MRKVPSKFFFVSSTLENTIQGPHPLNTLISFIHSCGDVMNDMYSLETYILTTTGIFLYKLVPRFTQNYGNSITLLF